MRICITGGAGYCGYSIIEKLYPLKEVESIIVYDNLSRSQTNLFYGNLISDKLQFVSGDILNNRLLKSTLRKVDCLIHCAAKVTTPFANQDPHYFEQTNHWGSALLADIVAELDLKKVIYMSTASVYGSHEEEITPDLIPNPRTYYGISKLRGEKHFYRFIEKVGCYILRPGNIYGQNPCIRFDSVINKMMFDANFFGRVTINGNGKQWRPFIHVDRLALLIKNIIIKKDYIDSGIYTLVEFNKTILEIKEAISQVYPGLEFLSVNHHLNLKTLRINTDSVIELVQIKDFDLLYDLNEFKASFSFKKANK